MGTEIAEGCVTAGGWRMAYLHAGPEDGPPLLLVHGLLSDKTTGDRAVPALAERGLRVYAVDLLGHGASAAPSGTYLLEDFAVSLQAFLTALGLESVSVCGHSLGGAIAIHFGYRFPGSVDRLVLVSA